MSTETLPSDSAPQPLQSPPLPPPLDATVSAAVEKLRIVKFMIDNGVAANRPEGERLATALSDPVFGIERLHDMRGMEWGDFKDAGFSATQAKAMARCVAKLHLHCD